MQFALIDALPEEFPMHCLCRASQVSQSGSCACRGCPACRRHEAMRLLAHVRSVLTLSKRPYGSPRMTWTLRTTAWRPDAAEWPA